ncbi:hypothetical protein D3C83_228290 [compost metagenome]
MKDPAMPQTKLKMARDVRSSWPVALMYRPTPRRERTDDSTTTMARLVSRKRKILLPMVVVS